MIAYGTLRLAGLGSSEHFLEYLACACDMLDSLPSVVQGNLTGSSSTAPSAIYGPADCPSFEIGEYVKVSGDAMLRGETGWVAGLIHDGRVGIASVRGGCMYVAANAIHRVPKKPKLADEDVFKKIEHARRSSPLFLPIASAT